MSINWTDLVHVLRHSDDKALAALVGVMWQAASERADGATLGNLLMSQMDCYNLAQALDYARVPPDQEFSALFNDRRGPPLRMLTPLPPFDGEKA